MDLKKFKINHHKRNVIVGSSILFVILLALILIYRSYAIYQEHQEYDAIEGKVPSFLEDFDVKLAVTIDGEAQTRFPSKDSGKAVSSIICDKGASASWDYLNWTIIIKNVMETRTKCQVNFVTKYSENLLNGTDPVLKDGMVPITIEANGTVRKASLGKEWYKYEDKKWANAVILNNEFLQYSEGEIIPEDNIESYFVWIPRYRYQIFNDGNYNTQTGILVDNKLPSQAEVDALESEMIQIKPNVNSWRNIKVANVYLSSYGYKRDYNSHMMKNTEWGAVAYLQHSKYGSQTSVRLNNNSDYVTGYAAVDEPSCEYIGDNQTCNKYGTEASITQPWNTDIGYLASTTGNISGIYDMSGSAWEYMMGIMVDKNGNPLSGKNSLYNSGFNGTFGCPTCDGDTSGLTSLTNGYAFPTDPRYYDQYAYAENDETYNRRILGDATGEMGPFAMANYVTQNRKIGSWYGDEAWFVSYLNPWFLRDSYYYYGNVSGIFAFGNAFGSANNATSFRVVLTI